MKYLFFLSTIFLASLMACNDNDCVEGGGSLADFPITVDSFDKISVAGPVNIRITQGAEQEVVIQAEPEIFGIMEYKVKNHELIIDFENKSCFTSDVGVMLNVTVPSIERIEISGTSDISSIGDLDLNQLTIKVSGVANVDLSGRADSQTYDVSGSIEVKSFDFVTKDMNIDISGAGDLEVNCSDNLDVKVSGSANVAYKGTPRITQNVSGVLTLTDSN